MDFNPEPTKQAQEFIFSRKAKELYHPPLVFNNSNISQSSSQKHLGVLIETKLTFDEHLKMLYLKIKKTLGHLRFLRKLRNLLSRSALNTIYKAFVRSHLYYGGILYGKSYNMSFHQKLESIQCDACLAITYAIRGTSKGKLYQELGLESLQLRHCYRNLAMFHNICKSKISQYLFKLITEKNHAYATRNVGNIPFFNIRHNFFKNSFFSPTIIEWKNLDPFGSFVVFKSNILKFIRPSPGNVFHCDNHDGIRLITWLRVSSNSSKIFRIVLKFK